MPFKHNARFIALFTGQQQATYQDKILSTTPTLFLTGDSGAYQSAGGVISGNGDVVGQWQDQSGNGNHVAQATTANKPSLVTNAVNGHAVVAFSGAALPNNKFLSRTGFSLAAHTLFVVISNIGNPGVFRHVAGQYDTTNSHRQMRTTIWTTNAYRASISADGLSGLETSPEISAAGSAILMQRYTGTIAQLYKNGGTGSTRTLGLYNAVQAPFCIGDLADTSQPLNAYIAEVIFYNRSLTNAEATIILDLQAERYGISCAPLS